MLLQTANVLISEMKYDKHRSVKLTLDPGSQQGFITEIIIKTLDLKPVRSVIMGISGVLSNKECEMSLKEYDLKITSTDGKYTNLIFPSCLIVGEGKRIYFKFVVLGSGRNLCNQEEESNALGVPKIFPNIQGQNLSCVTQNQQLADKSQGKTNDDIFIGADLYWQFVMGETMRSNACNLVAIQSVFGCICNKKR